MRIAPKVAKAALVVGLIVAMDTPVALAADDPVSAMTAPLYQRVNPTTRANLVTPWSDEAAGAAASYNFSVDLGTPFRASTKAVAGLTSVHRLYRASVSDFTWALEGSAQLKTAVANGYADQGTSFWAAATQLPGTVPVNSYTSRSVHRLWSGSNGAVLTDQGWSLESVAFYVPGQAPTSPTSPPPAPSTPTTTTVGSVPVGAASYPAPANAVYVSPTGSDSAAGSAGAPVRTVSRGVALAPSGGTVVLRAGSYHESVTIQGKTVTVQNYPNEAAWLDGSEPVTGWVQDGSSWRKDGWTTRFDHSPTYTQGASDSTVPDWQFVNASYPMAAHPDQVFVDGAALKQVPSRDRVAPGTFFLDEATSRLFLGSDPRGHEVAASTLVKAMTVRGDASVIRGVGIRRYSPSVFHMGSVTVEAPRVQLENVVIADAATTGISVLKPNVSLTSVSIEGSGMLGVHARFADGLVLDRVRSTGNNDERFNVAPVSGGVKVGQTRGLTVRNSDISRNLGQGVWTDMSVYNIVVQGSTVNSNSAAGIFLEISGKAVVANNVVTRNGGEGIKINNTSNVQIWNNTLVGNGRPLNLVQDGRRNTNPSDPAVDPRVPFPDPEMSWTLGPVVVRNNVVAEASSAANCLLCVEDYSHQASAAQMGISANSNVYHRASATAPTWLVVWSRGAGNPAVFTTLAQATAATGQETKGREFVGPAIVDSAGVLLPSVESLTAQIAQPLPQDIAGLIGKAAGTVHLGAW